MEKQANAAEAADSGMVSFPFLTGFNGSAMRMAVWPIEFWLRWQADLFQSAAPATADWMARRCEGSEFALQALQRLCACGDAQEAAKVQSDWVADETERLERDFRLMTSAVAFWPQASVRAGRQIAQIERAV